MGGVEVEVDVGDEVDARMEEHAASAACRTAGTG
jgi:hypothetical protein